MSSHAPTRTRNHARTHAHTHPHASAHAHMRTRTRTRTRNPRAPVFSRSKVVKSGQRGQQGGQIRTCTASYFPRISRGRSFCSALVPLRAPISRRDAPAWNHIHRNRWSNSGQMAVKRWSNGGQKEARSGSRVEPHPQEPLVKQIKRRSNGGQKDGEEWFPRGSTPTGTAARRSNGGQTVVNQLRSNGVQTAAQHQGSNGGQTAVRRRSNGGQTAVKRRSNGGQTAVDQGTKR
jgi:hypothetical protein